MKVQNVLNFTVSAVLPNSTAILLLRGQSVGHKFVRPVPPVNASKVLLYVPEALAILQRLSYIASNSALHRCLYPGTWSLESG